MTHSINAQAFGSEAQVIDSEVTQTRGARRGHSEQFDCPELTVEGESEL